jgi:heterodisulfide reductase subunit C
MGKGLRINAAKRETFQDKVRQELPEGGNVNLCLTCGACASGCPATGLLEMDPRKFLRMAAMGMDDALTVHKWV